MRTRLPAPLPIIAVVLSTSVLAMIDQTIVNVAYDQIAASLGASLNEISWVSTAYLLAGIIASPLNGWLTAKIGRKRFFLMVVSIFGVGSFLCAIATNAAELGCFRFIQGIGGGLIGTTGFAILIDNCVDDRRGEALAIIATGGALGPMLGSVVGGYLLDNYAWPSIFLINVPLIAGALVLAATLDLDQSVKSSAAPISYVDLGFMFVALFALQYVIQEGAQGDWFDSAQIRWLSFIAVVAGAAFTVRQLCVPRPMVELRLFANTYFFVGNFINIAVGVSVLGVSFVLPLFLQQVGGFTPLQVAQFNIPAAITMLIGIALYNKASRLIPPYIMITLGLAGFAASLAVMAHYQDDVSGAVAILARATQGLSTGLFSTPLLLYAMKSMPKKNVDSASGLFNVVRQLSGMLTVGILGTTLGHADTYFMRRLLSIVGGHTYLLKMHELSRSQVFSLATHRAAVLSFDHMFAIVAACIGVSALVTIFVGLWESWPTRTFARSAE